MLRNYAKIALRNINRNKGYSFINVAGLAVGMACCILIMLWVLDETSFDRFHVNADRIYRIELDANIGAPLRAPVSNAPSAIAIKDRYPEVLEAARLTRPNEESVRYEAKQFRESGVSYADNSLFTVFSFPFVKGDPGSALVTPYTAVITEEMADKYFGDEDPIGKVLQIDGSDNYTITGVVKDVPANSHFTFNILLSFETLYEQNRREMEMWMGFRFYSYLLLADGTDYKVLEQKFPDLVNEHLGPMLEATGGSIKLTLRPLTDIHLHADMPRDLSSNGDIRQVYLFSAIALFVLLIACFNFINLATARSAGRAREVGIRKTFGAARFRLVAQFLGESVIYSTLALMLALILIELSLPLFNTLAGRELTITSTQKFWFAPLFVGFAVLVGMLAGIYPALFLSSFQPISVLKRAMTTGKSGARFRKALVVTQFVISIALIAGTLIIYAQLEFMRNKRLGFDKEHIVVLQDAVDTDRHSLSSLRQQLESVPGVKNVGASSMVPGRGMMKGVLNPEGFTEDQPQTMDLLSIDHEFIPALGIDIAAGRNFSAEIGSDTTDAVIINQKAAETFGWDDPIGKKFIFTPDGESDAAPTTMTVVGVVSDFHLHSLRLKIEPLFIDNSVGRLRTVSIKIESQDIPRTIAGIRSKWNELYPDRAFDYSFLDESFDSLYRSEERLADITLYFSALAIFVGCLGLFGMSSYAAERRTREISLRKVLGSSISGIVRLLSREFLMLVLVANIIAWPIAYYAMNRWLEDFAYRIDIGIGTFALSGLLALIVAMIAVSFQAVKASMTNPVNGLRHE